MAAEGRDEGPREDQLTETGTHLRPSRVLSRPSRVLAAVGLVALGIAFASRPADARGAAGQAWPPFVLVTGLLLIGLVADEDGAFAAVGAWFTRTSRRPVLRVVAAMGVMVAVTAVLNLDTTAAFVQRQRRHLSGRVVACKRRRQPRGAVGKRHGTAQLRRRAD